MTWRPRSKSYMHSTQRLRVQLSVRWVLLLYVLPFRITEAELEFSLVLSSCAQFYQVIVRLVSPRPLGAHRRAWVRGCQLISLLAPFWKTCLHWQWLCSRWRFFLVFFICPAVQVSKNASWKGYGGVKRILQARLSGMWRNTPEAKSLCFTCH